MSRVVEIPSPAPTHLAKLIVGLSLLRIGQNLVGVVDFGKFVTCSLISFRAVRMVLERELPRGERER